MEQSILKSTKKLLNVGVDDTSFDLDIITHINSAFSHLHQLGIGPVGGFVIEDATPLWADFLPDADPESPILNAVKSNVYLRARSYFDPPQTPHLMKALEDQLLESDVRLNMMREETEWVDPDPPDFSEGTVFGDPIILDGGDS